MTPFGLFSRAGSPRCRGVQLKVCFVHVLLFVVVSLCAAQRAAAEPPLTKAALRCPRTSRRASSPRSAGWTGSGKPTMQGATRTPRTTSSPFLSAPPTDGSDYALHFASPSASVSLTPRHGKTGEVLSITLSQDHFHRLQETMHANDNESVEPNSTFFLSAETHSKPADKVAHASRNSNEATKLLDAYERGY